MYFYLTGIYNILLPSWFS